MITRLLKRIRAYYLRKYIKSLELELEKMQRLIMTNPDVRFHLLYVEARARIEATIDDFADRLIALEKQ